MSSNLVGKDWMQQLDKMRKEASEMTSLNWIELVEVLEDAVDNAFGYLTECQSLYSANFRRHRLEAADDDHKKAIRVLACIKAQVERRK